MGLPSFTLMRSVLLALPFLLVPLAILGQGCSDAGVCSMGSMESGQHQDSLGSEVAVGLAFGLGERFDPGPKTLITTGIVSARLKVLSGTFIEAKFPATYVRGDLGSSAGIGDATLSLTQQLWAGTTARLLVSIGAKIPGNTSNLTAQGRHLPMPYQSSLGSYDALLGATLLVPNWQFSAGYQHVFNSNSNEFLHASWAGVDPDAAAYFESYQLLRGNDLVARVERQFKSKTSQWFVGLLPIMRLQEDEIAPFGGPTALPGSRELTLNVTFRWVKSISEHLQARIAYASPVIWRETRADGLTRILVISTTLAYRFS